MPPTRWRSERAGFQHQPDLQTTTATLLLSYPGKISLVLHVPEFSKQRQPLVLKNNTVILFSNSGDE